MVSRDKEEPWKRYMFPVKSSLAPEGEPIGFELDKEKGFSLDGKMSDKYRGIAGCGKKYRQKMLRLNIFKRYWWWKICQVHISMKK